MNIKNNINNILKSVLFGVPLVFGVISCESDVGINEEKNVERVFESARNDISETTSLIRVFKESQPTDIYFIDDNTGYISGSFDYEINKAVMAKTVDGGNTWKAFPVTLVDGPIVTGIHNIYAKSSDEIYAYVSLFNGFEAICVSYDGGNSWIKTKSGEFSLALFYGIPQNILNEKSNLKDPFYGCTFVNENVGYGYSGSISGGVAGDVFTFGSIFKTYDSGNSWIRLDDWNDSAFPQEVLFFDEYHGAAFTVYGDIYQTTDGGEKWVSLKDVPKFEWPSAIKTKNNDVYISSSQSITKTSEKFDNFETIFENDVSLGKIVQIPDKSIFVLSPHTYSVIKINI